MTLSPLLCCDCDRATSREYPIPAAFGDLEVWSRRAGMSGGQDPSQHRPAGSSRTQSSCPHRSDSHIWGARVQMSGFAVPLTSEMPAVRSSNQGDTQ